MDFLQVILLLILGFFAGIISVIAGVGGGVFFVTFITLLFLLPIDIAVDTSTFVILLSSCVGFITYLKQKRTTIKLSLIFAGFSILGSILCSLIFFFVQIDSTILKILFASTLLIAGVNMIYKAIRTTKDLNNKDLTQKSFSLQDHDYKSNFRASIPLFILAGFAANLLGIGGGIINTPVLNIILGYPIHNSTAISTSIIFFTAIYNTIIKSILGQIDYLIGFLIAIGAILGTIIGAKISKKMPRAYLQYFVAIVLIGLAIRMYF
ncbi:MAG: sulfite exporter TauE/SafE family protein [Candidatus Hodarchaeota archaeon]